MQRPSLISLSPGVIPGNEDHSPGPVPTSPAGPPCLRGFFMVLLPTEGKAFRPQNDRAPGANALGGECPPASACGRRLPLDFAPKDIRPRVPTCPAAHKRKAGSLRSCKPAIRQPAIGRAHV